LARFVVTESDKCLANFIRVSYSTKASEASWGVHADPVVLTRLGVAFVNVLSTFCTHPAIKAAAFGGTSIYHAGRVIGTSFIAKIFLLLAMVTLPTVYAFTVEGSRIVETSAVVETRIAEAEPGESLTTVSGPTGGTDACSGVVSLLNTGGAVLTRVESACGYLLSTKCSIPILKAVTMKERVIVFAGATVEARI